MNLTGRVGCVINGSSWRTIHLDARIRPLCINRGKLGNGVFAIGAVVGTVCVETGRESGEYAAARRDAHACGKEANQRDAEE